MEALWIRLGDAHAQALQRLASVLQTAGPAGSRGVWLQQRLADLEGKAAELRAQAA